MCFCVKEATLLKVKSLDCNAVVPCGSVRFSVVLCRAGVWHNFMLCVAAVCFLLLLPLLLFPFYSTGAGALVTEVVEVREGGGCRGGCGLGFCLCSMLLKACWPVRWVLCAQGSPASGPRGLFLGDLVTGLEECEVSGVDDWHSCIQQLSLRPQAGYCRHHDTLLLNRAAGRGTSGTHGTQRTVLMTRNQTDLTTEIATKSFIINMLKTIHI